MLKIHESITNKLDYFIENNKIPNILIHGPPGSGKRTILKRFIEHIYEDDMKHLIMYIECGHGKGIKFIRDEVNYFAKTNCKETMFKTIVLLNADNLTIDAQSALRRSIEVFSKSTRYFIVLHDKNKLLNPLVSRFCELYVPLPCINNKYINLHEYQMAHEFAKHENKKQKIIKNVFTNPKFNDNINLRAIELSKYFYDNGVNAQDFITFLKSSTKYNKNLFTIEKMACSIKCEKLLLFSIISVFLRSPEV